MSRRSRKGGPSPLVGIVLLAVIAAGLAVAWHFRHSGGNAPPDRTAGTTAPPATSPVVISAERVDPANDGRVVAADGALHADIPPRDAQLGIVAPAGVAALLRTVEMLQWREHCKGSECEYTLGWSETPVDSSGFRERKGHENAAKFPFSTERFLAADLRLGAFQLDRSLAETASESPIRAAFPVRAAQLPPNLAATFRDRGGTLYAGNDPDKPAAGDLRVSYRTVAAGKRRVIGEQHGDRLQAAAKP